MRTDEDLWPADPLWPALPCSTKVEKHVTQQAKQFVTKPQLYDAPLHTSRSPRGALLFSRSPKEHLTPALHSLNVQVRSLTDKQGTTAHMVNRLYLGAKNLAPRISCSQLQFQDCPCPLISWYLLYQLLSF